jgi:hypothetical protein
MAMTEVEALTVVVAIGGRIWILVVFMVLK